jgi:acetoacetate decarboxylase
MPFPSPPWRLTAQAWVSVFWLRDTGRLDRPSGPYVAAFVDYGTGGVLAYHELLVARLLGVGRSPRVRVTDIWVDSAESMAGGRALWALPKRLADLPLQQTPPGIAAHTSFAGVAEGQRLAAATFTGLPGAAVLRVPFAVTTSQVRDDGSTVVASAAGSARPVPCRASWDVPEVGPLGFLHGRRPVLSLAVREIRLRFG